MLPSASLLTTLFLALSIVASPVVSNSTVTLPIARRLNTSNGAINILQHDRARMAALKRRSASPLDRRASFGQPIINTGFNYVTPVGIGDPQDLTTCKFNLEKNCGCQWIVLYRQPDCRLWYWQHLDWTQVPA